MQGETRAVSKAQDLCPDSVCQLCVGEMLQAHCKPFIFWVCLDLVLLPNAGIILLSNAGISNGKYLYGCTTQEDVKRRRKEIPIHMPY